MKVLKEHRIFRNQLIVMTFVLLIVGFLFSIGELIGFGVIFGLIALFNVYTYNENKKYYKEVNNLNKDQP